MRFLLALFDQSTRNSNNCYWTWFHPELTASLLSRVYDEAISRNLPVRPQDVGPNDSHGGLMSLDGWLCCYRIVNGGLDTFGREGRFVPICAFAKLSEASGKNCVAVLESLQVRDLAKAASVSCPVPAPPRLEFNMEMPRAQDVTHCLEEVIRSGSVRLFGDDAFTVAGSLVANLAGVRSFRCEFARSATETVATVSSVAVNTGELPPVSPPISPTLATVAGSAVNTGPDFRYGWRPDRDLSGRSNARASGSRGPEEIELVTAAPYPTHISQSFWWTHRSHFAVGIVCVVLGSLVGFIVHSMISKPVIIQEARFVDKSSFQIRVDEHEPLESASSKTTFTAELIPNSLHIEKWAVDGNDEKPGSDRFILTLGDGSHKWKVKFSYRDQDGIEKHVTGTGTVTVDSSRIDPSKVNFQPESFQLDK